MKIIWTKNNLFRGNIVAFDWLTHQKCKSQQICIDFNPCYQFHCDYFSEYLKILLLSFRYRNLSLWICNSHLKNILNSLNILTRQDLLVVYSSDFLLVFNFTRLHIIFRVYFDFLSSSQIYFDELHSNWLTRWRFFPIISLDLAK